MAKELIDFLVIGAQKSGTTSLFKYIQHHSSLYLPPQKEVEFFVNDAVYSKGVDWYLDVHFSDVDERKLRGEVCPAYMGYRSAPARIHAEFPEIKLIAILRNPVDRAYSHYRMAVRRGTETRPFREVIEAQKNEGIVAPETKSTGQDDSPFVLSFSLYGKTLDRYLKYFEREQILILFQEDLDSNPRESVARLFSFLGVDDSYEPDNLGREYHVGGIKRFPRLGKWIMQQEMLKSVGKKVLRSESNIQAARFWFEQFDIKPVKDQGPSGEDRDSLKRVFETDVELLERCLLLDVPWTEFKS